MKSESKKEVTLVCCYNEQTVYESFQKTLEKQTIPYELIGIDNCHNQYLSCSVALNAGLKQVQTEYVIFSHQDIELEQEDVLSRFLAYLKQIKEEDILGLAGIIPERMPGKKKRAGEEGGTVLSAIKHGAKRETAGERDFSGLIVCDSLDECFFGGRTAYFKKNPFDEKLCDNWHLYGVEACLRTRARGGKVYVCDVPAVHTSKGHINHAYNENFRRLAKAYRQRTKHLEADCRINVIRTVCGSCRNDWLHRNLFYLKRELLIRMGRLG